MTCTWHLEEAMCAYMFQCLSYKKSFYRDHINVSSFDISYHISQICSYLCNFEHLPKILTFGSFKLKCHCFKLQNGRNLSSSWHLYHWLQKLLLSVLWVWFLQDQSSCPVPQCGLWWMLSNPPRSALLTMSVLCVISPEETWALTGQRLGADSESARDWWTPCCTPSSQL